MTAPRKVEIPCSGNPEAKECRPASSHKSLVLRSYLFFSVARLERATLVLLQTTKSLEDNRFQRNPKKRQFVQKELSRLTPCAAGIADAKGSVRLRERIPREALALGPHIISTQLSQCVGYKFSGDSLAPGHIEIGVVERFSDSRRECGCFFDGLLI